MKFYRNTNTNSTQETFLSGIKHPGSIQYRSDHSQIPSLLRMLMVILQSLACLLLQALDIMFRISNLFPIRLDLPFPNSSASYRSVRAVILPSCSYCANKSVSKGTYCRLRTTTQLLLPVTFPLLLLVQLIVLVVVDLGFPVVRVLVYN